MNHMLTRTTLDEFERVYRIFEANGDGHLTRQEIADALEVLGRDISPDDRASLFDLLDGGVVTHDSFIEWMAQRKDLDVTADLRQIFQLIDVDGSGYLSFAEFTEIVRCLNPAATDLEIAELVRAADLDGDGQIDFEEFIATQASGSQLQMTVAALRSFKKILRQYAKVAEVDSIALVEVDSDLGAGKRGASKGIEFLKQAAIQKQSARMRTDNGVVSLDNRVIQNENHALADSKHYPHFKYMDSDNSGTIDFEEFGELMLRHRRLMANYREFTTYFLPIDANGDDAISLEEMNVAMASVGEAKLSERESAYIDRQMQGHPLTWNRFVEMLLVT